jgi:AcrB/AcrD/AcrF family
MLQTFIMQDGRAIWPPHLVARSLIAGPHVQDVIARALRLGGGVDDEPAVIEGLSHGARAQVQRPLGTVVIGGLITSMPFTLCVLPIIYRRLERGEGDAAGGEPEPSPGSESNGPGGGGQAARSGEMKTRRSPGRG